MDETSLATLLFKVQDNITTAVRGEIAAVRGDVAKAEQGITARLNDLSEKQRAQDEQMELHTRVDAQSFAEIRSDVAKLHVALEERTSGGLLRLHLTPKQKTALWTIAVSGAGVLLEFLRQLTVWLAGKGSVHP